MPGIEIRNLTRTTDIDDIYNGIIPLSINNETVGAVFGTALGSVTNCLNASLYYSNALSGGFLTLSSIQITNNAKITNLVTQALTANSEITQQGACLDAKASIGCVNTIQNEIDTIDGKVSANSTDITQINNSVTNLNDVLTLKSAISTTDGITSSVNDANTRIDNTNAEIATINTTLTNKAGCTDVNSINARTTQLEQNLQQSAVEIRGAAANTLFLSACIDGNTGSISQNAANVVTLESQLSGLCNNLVNANASDILVLNTQMSDVNTLTSNFIAAQASKLTLLNTSLETSAANVCQLAVDQLNLQSCVSTLTSQLLTSGARIDVIEVAGFANATDITTLNNGITAVNLSLGTAFVDQTNLSASFLTQTFNVSSLSAEMVTTIQNLTAKASADQAELIAADVRAVSSTAGTASTRTTQLCSEIVSLETNTLTPTFTSLVVQINNRAFANDLEQLSTFAEVNNTSITNLDSKQTVLESNINTLTNTFLTNLTAADGAVLGGGTVVFDAITAKANLTDFAFLSSCIDTEVSDIDYTYGRLNALSAVVVSVSSNTGGLSSEIAARATCGDFFSLRTQLTGGEYATAASIFGENGLEAAINTTLQTCTDCLDTRINTIDGCGTVVVGDLRASLDTLINGITGNPNSLNLAVSSNFTLLSSYFDNLSSFTGSFNTSYNFLSGQFAQLSAFAQSLSGNIINDALTVAIETKASVTCVDNLRLEIDQNALSSFGEIQTGKAESLVLSGITTNIINTIGDGSSPDTLSAAVLQRASLTEVCSLYNTITGGVLSGVGIIGGQKAGVTSLQSQLLSLSSSIQGGLTGLRNTLSAVNDIVDICTLKNTVNIQGLSATSLCNNVAALNTTLANVSAGTVNVALSAVNSLESRLNAVECGFGGFLDGSICQTCNVVTTITDSIDSNKTEADSKIAALFSNVVNATQTANNAGTLANIANNTGIAANELASCAKTIADGKASQSSFNTLNNTVAGQANIISSNTTAAADAKTKSEDATLIALRAQTSANNANVNTTEANNKIADINSVYGIKVDAQGHVAGFDLIANAKVSEGGQVQSGDSSFIVTADRFTIAGQDSNDTSITPFCVENNIVSINTAHIKNLCGDCITANSLNVAGAAIDGSIGLVGGTSGAGVLGTNYSESIVAQACRMNCSTTSSRAVLRCAMGYDSFCAECFLKYGGAVRHIISSDFGNSVATKCNVFDYYQGSNSYRSRWSGANFPTGNCYCECVCFASQFGSTTPQVNVVNYGSLYYTKDNTNVTCGNILGYDCNSCGYGNPGPLFYTSFCTADWGKGTPEGKPRTFLMDASVDICGQFNSNSKAIMAVAVMPTTNYECYKSQRLAIMCDFYPSGYYQNAPKSCNWWIDYGSGVCLDVYDPSPGCAGADSYIYSNARIKCGEELAAGLDFQTQLQLLPDTCYYVWAFATYQKVDFNCSYNTKGLLRNIKGFYNGTITMFGLNK